MLKFKQKIKMWRCLVGSGPRGKHCFLLLLRIFQLIIWSFQDRKIISSLINVWQSIPAQIFKPVHLLFKIILIMKNFKYIRNTESGTTDNYLTIISWTAVHVCADEVVLILLSSSFPEDDSDLKLVGVIPIGLSRRCISTKIDTNLLWDPGFAWMATHRRGC